MERVCFGSSQRSENYEVGCLPATPGKGANPGCPGQVPAQEPVGTLSLPCVNKPGTNMSKHQCVRGVVSGGAQTGKLPPPRETCMQGVDTQSYRMTLGTPVYLPMRRAEGIESSHHAPISLGQALDPEHKSNALASGPTWFSFLLRFNE